MVPRWTVDVSHIDDKLSYVIFNMFFSHFQLVLFGIRGVLEQLPIGFRIFCNVYILSHIILVFPKRSSYMVFLM